MRFLTYKGAEVTMNTSVSVMENNPPEETIFTKLGDLLRASWYGIWNFVGGLAILFGLWWLSVFLITLNPEYSLFEDSAWCPRLWCCRNYGTTGPSPTP